ncbi:MAG: histidine kinase [Bacteroidales bacterium]|nr:histidine kinase [Bacteroidales bacterium]
MKTFLKILTNPFLIAALLALILAFIFPVKHTKYKVSSGYEIVTEGKKKVFFRDVNHDGIFEMVILYYGNFMPRIGINTAENKIYGEAGMRGMIKPEDEVAFFDINSDSVDEAFTITRRGDSVFLAVVTLNLNSNIRVNTKYLFTIGEINGQPDWTTVSKFHFHDINNDGYTDVIFSYSALYSLQPRSIIAYDLKRDSILLSPLSGVKCDIFEITDINHDGFSEILLQTGTAENYKDTNAIPFHDHTPWLMALDHNLKFFTPPRPFHEKPATFSLFTLQNKDTLLLAGYLQCYGTYSPFSSLLLFDSCFNISKTLNIANTRFSFIQHHERGDLICLTFPETGTMLLYDYKLNLKQTVNLIPYTKPLTENKYIKQVNIQGKSFLVFYNQNINSGFFLLDDRYNLVTRIDFKELLETDAYSHYQLFETNDEGVKFFIQAGNRLWEHNVNYDKYWYFAYWRYPAYYTLMLGLVFLLQYLFKLRQEQQKKTENEILSLQLKSTLNQLDPHFTFNTLNMISGLIAANRREEASNYLVQFSKLMRATVAEGEKTMVTLEQELSFVNIYLAMQQIRTGNNFEYTVKVHGNVDQGMLIPKRIIHTHVENAVKHGLMNKEGDKHILVEAMQSGKDLCIEISDNGIGREKARKINPYKNTGQGLRITQQILELTGNLSNKKFMQEIIDLKDKEGRAAGTKVVLRIEL